MKKWFFVFAALAAIVIVGQIVQDKKLGITPRSNIEFMKKDDKADKVELMTFDRVQVHSGKLLLINGDYPLASNGRAKDLVTISAVQAAELGLRLENNELTLSEEVLQSLQTMFAAASKEGVNGFLLTSGYRSLEQQATLYEQSGSDYALPAGNSEHNSGLAIDISSVNGKMESAEEGEWLRKHAAQYGFILRYPPNKQHITGIQYEPWHFRYVGNPHSTIMLENDWVLEEYVQYIASNPHLEVNVQGQQYSIDYYDYELDEFIQLYADNDYMISGDNVRGIIVTSWKEEQ